MILLNDSIFFSRKKNILLYDLFNKKVIYIFCLPAQGSISGHFFI